MADIYEVMNITEMDKKDIKDITESLLDEYTENEIEEMLDKASFLPLPVGFIVTYESGTIDQFVSVNKLIHVDDYNKRLHR
jgi:hypothetical protein